MTSIRNTENPEVTENHTSTGTLTENFDPDYILDENEAKEINSCLNFLSILDEESSNDSCEFTLFRKKDDVGNCSKERESKNKDSCNPDPKEVELGIKALEETKSEDFIEDNENLTKIFSKSRSPDPEKKSPDFKITSTKSPKIFKISSLTKGSISKKETKSFLQSANNIVLKVPRFPKKLKLSPQEDDGDLKSQHHTNNKEKKLEIKCKPLNSFSNSLQPESNNLPKKSNKYSESNGLVPQKLRKFNIVLKKYIDKNDINNIKLLPMSVSSNSDIRSKFEQNLHMNKQNISTINSNNTSISANSDACFENKSDLIEIKSPFTSLEDDTESKSPKSDDTESKSPSSQLLCEEIFPISNSSETDDELVPKHLDPLELDNQLPDDSILEINKSQNDEIEILESKLNPKKAKVKKVSPIKKVKTRIRKGRKYKPKKKKVIDLTRAKQKPGVSISTCVATEVKEQRVRENKYIPLQRTGLPTFLNQLDSHESDQSSVSSPASTTPVSGQVDNESKKPRTQQNKLKKKTIKPKTLNKGSKTNNISSSECNAMISRKDNTVPDNQSKPTRETEPLIEPPRMEEVQSPVQLENPDNYSVHTVETVLSQDVHIPSVNNEENSKINLSLNNADNLLINSFISTETISEEHFQDISNSEPESSSHDSHFSSCGNFEELSIGEETLDAPEAFPSSEFNAIENCVDRELFFPSSAFKNSHEAPEMVEANEEILDTFSSREVESVANTIIPDTNTQYPNDSPPEEIVLNNINIEKECSNVIEPPSEDRASPDSRVPGIIYSYNKSSPLSFCVQNILEHMFKHESFPSSTNMARLAKLMKVQWKEVRDWFVARRHLNKKNGIFSRNQPLISCAYCPQYLFSNHIAMVHLLTKEHIQNMIVFMEKDMMIFSKFQKENQEKEDDQETNEPETQTSLVHREEEPPSIAGGVSTRTSQSGEPPPDSALPNPAENVEKRPKPRNEKPAFAPSQLDNKLDPMEDNSCYKVDDSFKVPEPPAPKLQEPDLNVDRKTLQRKWRSMRQADSRIYVGYRCPDCAKIFQSEWMLIRHSITHKKLICSECNEVFLREDLLQHHFKEHLIESMEAELYSMYLCFKCFNLNCVCGQDDHYIPSVQTKHYLRPQMAKRSKPFHSVPYSGINEHLKVTLSEFWHEVGSLERNSIHLGKEKRSNDVECRLQKQEKPHGKKMEASITPTYTNITTFNCDICESFFFTQDELEDHAIVHRIQASSRDRKRLEREREEKREKHTTEFLKPSAPVDPFFFCSYCTKGYKKDKSLKKHIKFECKNLPKNVTKQISGGDSFDIEKAGKGNHYKVKLKPLPPSPVLKSPVVNSSESSHKTGPSADSTPKTSNPTNALVETPKHTSKPIPKVQQEKDENFYFFCRYCGVPLTSVQLNSHVSRTCPKAPNNVKSDLSSNVDKLKRYSDGRHYHRISKAETKPFPPKIIPWFFDTATFPSLKTNYKRMKCKFCDKHSLTSCLKLHLIKQCKSVPEQIRFLLGRSNNRFDPNNLSAEYNLVHANEIEPHTVVSKPPKKKTDALTAKSSKNKTNKSLDRASTDPKRNLLYDCHLCEEKFKVSKDFIAHMSNFHCMTISEDSSSQWLSDVNTKSTSKTPEKCVDAQWASAPTKDAKECSSRSKKSLPDKKVVDADAEKPLDEKVIDADSNLESIAETLLVSDYAIVKDGHCRSLPTAKRRGSTCSSTESPSKSQKMDDDELLGDLDNLDSFIETVQLEDSSFVSSL